MDVRTGLISAYKRYGFVLARDASRDGVLVFTLKTGYFDNAEIVKLTTDAKTDEVFNEFSSAGYACTVREAKSPQQAEEELFSGFFSVESTKRRLLDDYMRFTSALVQPYGEAARYEYIKAPYQINGRDGQSTPPEEVLSRIGEEGPILFLIEAAAGFGKTCTAQEIAKLLVERSSRLPLYAELSRNRQARIFRYILLDEIDRTFPLLNSSLVQTEIRNGRIATILDGFDELLRKGDEGGDFENKEPMLETVSELLTGRAKVIITTRRTVLFDGDEFHQWLDRHAEVFSVVRIRIQEPRVKDWLIYERMHALTNAGIDINAMANPVLLSFLRCVDDKKFETLIYDPGRIVQSYFEYMLDREKERQDLRMTSDMQSDVLRVIADDMVLRGYTAEQRDFLVKMLLERCVRLIEAARSQYAAGDRPSREELANKLASHALLDRSASDASKIGFVNDFALGNYVGDNIIRSAEWLGDDLRFIEPAVKSYAPRSESVRRELFEALQHSWPYLDVRARVEISSGLIKELPVGLENGYLEGVELSCLNIGADMISTYQFGDVIFKSCQFNRSGLNNVTFLNCKFFDCNVDDSVPAGFVYVLGGECAPDIESRLSNLPVRLEEVPAQNRDRLADCVVLRKFWPIGESFLQRPSRPIYKPTKFVCQPVDGFSSSELYDGLSRLLKLGVLVELNRSNLISLDLGHFVEAQRVFEACA